jgi:acetyl-CoA acetyltransferase
MRAVYICESVRTPIGRYGGSLATIRTDNLAAHPLSALRLRFEKSDWESVDEVVLGCVNQAGEDNRNVARRQLYWLAFHALYRQRQLIQMSVFAGREHNRK